MQKRLELARTQILTVVLEIPSILEYIDFVWRRARLQTAKMRGYRRGRGLEEGRNNDTISHNTDVYGMTARVAARYANALPYNRA